MCGMETLTPAGLRAARALLQWKLEDVERATGIAFSTVHRIEQGGGRPRPATVAKLLAAFRAHGVEVLPPPADGARRIPES
jgi:transcriptional regulator with XRE-family HTH domain